MCLDTVIEAYAEPQTYCGIGYKVMLRCESSKNYAFSYRGKGCVVPGDHWVHEHNHRTVGSLNREYAVDFIYFGFGHYPTGFHIYDRYEDAVEAMSRFGFLESALLLVNYTGVVAEGSEYAALRMFRTLVDR